jgi:hypothetical protein
MKLEPLGLEHSLILQPLFKGLDLELSDYSFANLFLFRARHKPEVVIAEDIYIQGVGYDGMKYIMPCSEKAAKNNKLLLELVKETKCLFPIPDLWLPFYTEYSDKAFYKDEDSDYLFCIESMATYKGRHLSKKRNLLKQFLEQYEVHTVPLEQAPREDVYDLLARWKGTPHTDIEETKEAIEYQSKLGLEGWLFYSNSKAIGLLIGEPLNSRIYVIHFAKADTSYKGVYQYMYHAYAEALLKRSFTLLNLEQDLGIPELRQSKHSYQPVKIAPKWRISLDQSSL